MVDIYRSPAGKEAVEGFYRKVLQRWPVPNRQVVVPTCEGDTFVIISGQTDATPVVLLHGSGTNSSAWIQEVPEWAQHYRVYSVDMIGEPGFSAPSRPPLASTRYAAWLDDVWNHLGLQSASLVGVSLGGWLALDYAVRRREKVSSLTLLSPFGIGRQNRLCLVKIGLLRMCGSWGLRRFLKLVSGNANMPRALSDALVSLFRVFRPRMERIPIRTDEELSKLTMPVQLILGGKDVLVHSNETRDRMERLVPHLDLRYLENEGHILPKQTRAIAEFLSAVHLTVEYQTTCKKV